VGRATHHKFIGVTSFLQASVVEGAMGVEALTQGDVLLGRRAQAELVGASHFSPSHWCWVYRVTVVSATSPSDAATYDVDQRTRR
jgi:hypothetical protein